MDPRFIEELLHEEEGTALDFKRDQYPFDGADESRRLAEDAAVMHHVVGDEHHHALWLPGRGHRMLLDRIDDSPSGGHRCQADPPSRNGNIR